MRVPHPFIGYFAVLLLATGLSACAQARAQDQSETPEVAKVFINPHTLFVFDSVSRHYQDQRVWVLDGDSGKLLGLIPASNWANFALSPDGRFGYVAETEWARHRERHDFVSIHNISTLESITEVAISGRGLMSTKKPNFDVSADGHYAYVFNLDPGASVIVVDLLQRRELGSIDTFGCGLVFPSGDNGFASLCPDGTLLSVIFDADLHVRNTWTPAFFPADSDPVFEHSAFDRAERTIYLLSYTGLVRTVRLAESPVVDQPWSLQEAADLGRPGLSPQETAWRPGGWQLAAIHSASKRLYVLMHEGKFWTHKQPGTELWIFDLVSRKLISRVPLPVPVKSVAVSQDEVPILVLIGRNGNLYVLDAESGKLRFQTERIGDDPLVITMMNEWGGRSLK